MKKKIEKIKDMTFLFVEDEESLVEIIKTTFIKLGIDVHFAYNGKEALEILDEIKNIDIVCTDINMPIMNGYDLLEIINRDYNHLNKIVMSGNSTCEHDRKLAELKIKDENIVAKPFDFIKFLDVIYNMTH